MKYKAIVFDLDGTLLNTLDDLADSMNTVLKEHGFRTHETNEYKYLVGEGVVNLTRKALPPENRDDRTVDICFHRMREVYEKNCYNKTGPYDGILELLDILKKDNYKLAILTNKPDNAAQEVVKRFLPYNYFEIVYGERPPVPVKPDPTSALEIADFLDVAPNEIVYLGDTKTDMQTANSAGMYAVGVLWGFRKADELLAHGAKALIENPLELLKILE